MKAARQSKITEMAEANESGKGVMFGGDKDMADKMSISDIKIGPRFKVESSNQIPRSNYERKGGEILAHIRFYSSDSYFIRLRLSSDKTITTLMIRILFVMSFLGGIAIVMISIETIRETNASTSETAVQDPGELGDMMTQTGEEIRNELDGQGLIMREHLTNILGFNEIQSQLSLGYQFSFAGNISEAVSQARRADNALEATILSTFRTGQELTSLSQNRSLTLDNDTRQILMAVGNGLTDLGTQIREQRTSLIGMLG